MESSTSSLFIVLVVIGVASTYGQTTCCGKGNNLANIVFKRQDASCSADHRFAMLTSKEKKDFMCTFEFENCCRVRATSQFCQRGSAIASSGQECALVSGKGSKSAEHSCCHCCNHGKTAGVKGQSCDQQISQVDPLLTNLCSLSFKSCCEDSKKKNPAPNQKVKCSDIKCGENTQGCLEKDSGAQCQCKTGYQRQSSTTCVDLDECSSPKSNRCPDNAFCMNRKGYYQCLLNCPSPNYEKVSAKVCTDVDECVRGIHKCKPSTQRCVNHIGGYKCEQYACKKGLKLLHKQCRDINECKETPSICGKGKCQNMYGDFFCQCDRGFKFDSKTCVDINECSSNRHYCDYQCVNKEGGYECVCPKGYNSVGRDCVDINECLQSDKCPKGSYCFNTFGSFLCIEQACPDKSYYIQHPDQGEPDKCSKDCKEAPEAKKLECGLGRTPQSIKRVTYRYNKEIGVGGFAYNYWWSFSSSNFIVEPKLIKGNEDGDFKIEIISANQAKIINTRRIKGPKNYHIVMQNDARRRVRGEPLAYRYLYHFYIYVSEHHL